MKEKPLFDDEEYSARISPFHDDLDVRFQIVDYSMDMEYMENLGIPYMTLIVTHLLKKLYIWSLWNNQT